jgi:hypothetical protein
MNIEVLTRNGGIPREKFTGVINQVAGVGHLRWTPRALIRRIMGRHRVVTGIESSFPWG